MASNAKTSEQSIEKVLINQVDELHTIEAHLEAAIALMSDDDHDVERRLFVGIQQRVVGVRSALEEV